MLQAKPEKVISQFAVSIMKNHLQIKETWLSRVSQDNGLPNSDALTHLELLDHLPRLFEELCAFLQEQPEEETINKGEVKLIAAKIAARAHSHYRVLQGYNVYELVRELGVMHSIITSEELTDFVQKHPDCTPELEKQTRRLINEFFNSTTATSVEQFAKETDIQAIKYQEQLEIANKQLQETNERLHQLDQSRLSLVRTISHEMGNLLQALIGPIGLLRTNLDKSQRIKMFEIIKRNTYDMSTLLEQLNDYSSALAGQEKLSIDFFELAPLITEIVDIYRPMANIKGLNLTVTMQNVDGLFSDRLKLKRILTNLISNSIKYTSEGEIKLVVKPVSDHHYHISVEDTGEGISEENIARLFTEFQRFTTSKDLPGTGLGLAITKRLVGLLKGQIFVESKPGIGSRFEMILPTAISNDLTE